MNHLINNKLRYLVPIRVNSNRLLSQFNPEIDSDVKRIRKWKRLFALSLFGMTLTTALLVKNNKRKQWFQVLQQTRRLQGQKFGELELYEFRSLILAEPVMKSWNTIESFKFRENDIIVSSFPKTGITWLQEIVWLIVNDLDFTAAKAQSITQRFPYLEYPTPGFKYIELMKSPRLIKTHLTPSILFSNTKITERPKTIAILRNPKDVLVSYYHFSRMNKLIGYDGSFDEFFDRFLKGTVPYGPVWAHFLDLIDLNQNNLDLPFDEERVLIVFYEDLHRDFENQINRICDFVGKQKFNEQEMIALKTHCSFEKMKNNNSVNYQYWDDLGFRDRNESKFMRKGEIGDWKHYFSEEQNNIINQLIIDKFGKKIDFIYE